MVMNDIYGVRPEYNANNINRVVKYYTEPEENRRFLIRPVRNATKQDQENISKIIKREEEKGLIHYDPYHFTEQNNDGIGIIICQTNCTGIKYSGGVSEHIDIESTGSAFDNGMAYLLDKAIIIHNPDYLKEKTLENDSNKEYAEIISTLANNINFKGPDTHEEYKKLMHHIHILYNFKQHINDDKVVANFTWTGYEKIDLLKLGMVFAAGMPINILNIHSVEPTKGKSHQNLLIEMQRLSEMHIKNSKIKPEDYNFYKIN